MLRRAAKTFTHLCLLGYTAGTETGEYYEEYLQLSERPPEKVRVLLNYNLHEGPQSAGIVYFVWILKTLQEKPQTAPFLRSQGLITDSWAYWT